MLHEEPCIRATHLICFFARQECAVLVERTNSLLTPFNAVYCAKGHSLGHLLDSAAHPGFTLKNLSKCPFFRNLPKPHPVWIWVPKYLLGEGQSREGTDVSPALCLSSKRSNRAETLPAHLQPLCHPHGQAHLPGYRIHSIH